MTVEQLRIENERLKQWVSDLQSGMFVNCVYCGHRYGPQDEIPATMADALKQHVARCPKHPMSRLAKLCQDAYEVLGRFPIGDDGTSQRELREIEDARNDLREHLAEALEEIRGTR